MSKWKTVSDENVLHVWQCEEDDCEFGNEDCDVPPTYYQDNGTPMCQCDCDMAYQYTKVRG